MISFTSWESLNIFATSILSSSSTIFKSLLDEVRLLWRSSTTSFLFSIAITEWKLLKTSKIPKYSKKLMIIKSRFSWCRRTGAREAVLLFTRKCWQPLRNYGTMFASNWSSNGGLAAEASVTCRRSQWSNSSHFFFALFSAYAFFCDMTSTPKLGTKDLLKAQRWVVERESNLLPLLYKLNSLTPIPSLPFNCYTKV